MCVAGVYLVSVVEEMQRVELFTWATLSPERCGSGLVPRRTLCWVHLVTASGEGLFTLRTKYNGITTRLTVDTLLSFSRQADLGLPKNLVVWEDGTVY